MTRLRQDALRDPGSPHLTAEVRRGARDAAVLNAAIAALSLTPGTDSGFAAPARLTGLRHAEDGTATAADPDRRADTPSGHPDVPA